jgi:ABC-type spermidine/putrescine transport system permease subunit I
MGASRFAGRFLIPGGVWLLLFFAVPLGIVLAISFGTTDDLGGAIYGWYPENYSRASTRCSCRSWCARSATRWRRSRCAC